MFLLPDFLHLVSFGSGTGRTQLSSPLCLTFCLATPLFTSIAMMADVPMTISIVSSLLLLCTELHPSLRCRRANVAHRLVFLADNIGCDLPLPWSRGANHNMTYGMLIFTKKERCGSDCTFTCAVLALTYYP